MKVKVKIRLKDKGLLPVYSTLKSSGADLRADLNEDLEILPGESKLIPTGVHLEIPDGFEVQIRPRSGLALKSQITILNTPGTIDADYTGEILVILINHGKETFVVSPRMRIAQMVLSPISQMEFVQTENLAASERGSGGFGHTGSN